MLSRTDIENELGKGICIFPFNHNNFKENSINLCASCFAWTLSSGTLYYNESTETFSLQKKNNNEKTHIFTKGESSIWDINGKQYIILLPHSTTLVETEEVIAIGNNIGGTYHSKVGLVSQGIGHIGTMLGPNFTGNSLIAIHNITNEVLKIQVGDSFVSVVFHYLNTAMEDNNPTVSGHLDKMAQLGIHLNSIESAELGEDWRKKPNEVREKMLASEPYRQFIYSKKSTFLTTLKQYINKENIIIVIFLIVIVLGSFFLCDTLDARRDSSEFTEKWWDTIKDGLVITILVGLLSHIKKRD